MHEIINDHLLVSYFIIVTFSIFFLTGSVYASEPFKQAGLAGLLGGIIAAVVFFVVGAFLSNFDNGKFISVFMDVNLYHLGLALIIGVLRLVYYVLRMNGIGILAIRKEATYIGNETITTGFIKENGYDININPETGRGHMAKSYYTSPDYGSKTYLKFSTVDKQEIRLELDKYAEERNYSNKFTVGENGILTHDNNIIFNFKPFSTDKDK